MGQVGEDNRQRQNKRALTTSRKHVCTDGFALHDSHKGSHSSSSQLAVLAMQHSQEAFPVGQALLMQGKQGLPGGGLWRGWSACTPISCWCSFCMMPCR